MRILVTGRPGVGKTTLVRRVLEAGVLTPAAGFLTEEIRGPRGRSGFRIVTIDGRSAVLARAAAGSPRVGRYAVDLAAFEPLALEAIAIRPGIALYVVDEIGKMECLSPGFVEAARRLLDAPVPLLATVSETGGGFMAEARSRRDVRLVAITAGNRDSMAREVIDAFRPEPPPDRPTDGR